jgi:wyosine [tRNA(Phe)-imidazoG37] synthetase (radical SAM superfamily)
MDTTMIPLTQSKRRQAHQDPSERVREWSPVKRWNPFNSYKLLTHVHRWKQIKRGRAIPPPVLITVDPTNICNFNCAWCNAEYVRANRKGSLSEKILLDLADFLPRWGFDSFDGRAGVDAVCIAGGGEPLLNPATGVFIDKVAANGLQVGIVTNGSQIFDNIDSLSQCTWVGVSIDAGSSETFDQLKGLPSSKCFFDGIINSIAILISYARRHNNRLGYKHFS